MLQESIDAYAEICQHAPQNVRIAGGEGSDTVRMAEDFIVNGGAAVIQIDQGRIGGLTSTYQVRQLCAKHGRVFVNHSFKSHLSIAAGESRHSCTLCCLRYWFSSMLLIHGALPPALPCLS